MDWGRAEDTLQEVGMFLLAMDNADGLRKGLAQPDRRPSALTEKVFALMKEVRERRLVAPKNNLRRIYDARHLSHNPRAVGHALTTSGRVVCGRGPEHFSIDPGGLQNGDCKRCLGALKKLGIL